MWYSVSELEADPALLWVQGRIWCRLVSFCMLSSDSYLIFLLFWKSFLITTWMFVQVEFCELYSIRFKRSILIWFFSMTWLTEVKYKRQTIAIMLKMLRKWINIWLYFILIVFICYFNIFKDYVDFSINSCIVSKSILVKNKWTWILETLFFK